jgi:hypothetical protein
VLKNATPNTLHRVYYVCWPRHGPGQPICGAFELGTATTNDRGNANVHFEIENAPFAGPPNDHIDVRGGGPGCPICGSPVYIATPVVR